MKSFQGKAHNISRSTLCKVICEASAQEADAVCYLTELEHPNNTASNSKSVIIVNAKSALLRSPTLPMFQLSDDRLFLDPGDVVLLEPTGLGTILYKSNSFTNSVMLTERCNSGCVMCSQPPKNDQEDLVDLSLRLIKLMDSNTKVLGITGGEPTLSWEGLKEVLSVCHEYIPDASIQLLTNARLLKDYDKTEELAHEGRNNLFVCVPLYADVDTLHDEIVGARGAFWDTIEGIFNLGRAGVFIELRTVITQMNYSRLSQWAEYVYRTIPFTKHIAFMGMEPIGLAFQNIDRLWIDPADYISQLEKAIRILHRRNMHISIFNHQLCTLPRELWLFSRKSISEWKTIYISECDQCSVKSHCGGFFHSAHGHKSRNIKPIKH